MRKRLVLGFCFLLFLPVDAAAPADTTYQSRLTQLVDNLRNGDVSKMQVYIHTYNATYGPVRPKIEDFKTGYAHYRCERTLTRQQIDQLLESIGRMSISPKRMDIIAQWGVDFMNPAGDILATLYFSHKWNDGLVDSMLDGYEATVDDAVRSWFERSFPDEIMLRSYEQFSALVSPSGCENRMTGRRSTNP
jgi:hypothetical protein